MPGSRTPAGRVPHFRGVLAPTPHTPAGSRLVTQPVGTEVPPITGTITASLAGLPASGAAEQRFSGQASAGAQAPTAAATGALRFTGTSSAGLAGLPASGTAVQRFTGQGSAAAQAPAAAATGALRFSGTSSAGLAGLQASATALAVSSGGGETQGNITASLPQMEAAGYGQGQTGTEKPGAQGPMGGPGSGYARQHPRTSITGAARSVLPLLGSSGCAVMTFQAALGAKASPLAASGTALAGFHGEGRAATASIGAAGAGACSDDDLVLLAWVTK